MQRIPCRNLTDVFERIVDIPAGIACCRCNIPIALHLQHPSGFALPTIELALHLQHSSWHCTYQLLNWRCTCNIPTGIAPATHNVILAVAIAAINCVCTCNFPIANFDSIANRRLFIGIAPAWQHCYAFCRGRHSWQDQLNSQSVHGMQQGNSPPPPRFQPHLKFHSTPSPPSPSPPATTKHPDVVAAFRCPNGCILPAF